MFVDIGDYMSTISDCDETKLLVGDLPPDQLGTDKLSEKNCVEIVTKLVELQLVDLIKTTDNKEYLTRQQLDKEIRDELFVSGGRISLVEISSILCVDFDHVEHTARGIVEADRGENHLVLGQLVSQRYLDDLCRQLNKRLQQDGIVSLPSIGEELFLPLDFLIMQVNLRLGSIIIGFTEESDPKVIRTYSWYKINRPRVREVSSEGMVLTNVKRAGSSVSGESDTRGESTSSLPSDIEKQFVSENGGEERKSGSHVARDEGAKDCTSSGGVGDMKENRITSLCGSEQGHDELNNCLQPENCQECKREVLKEADLLEPQAFNSSGTELHLFRNCTNTEEEISLDILRKLTTLSTNTGLMEGLEVTNSPELTVCNFCGSKGHMEGDCVIQLEPGKIKKYNTKEIFVCGEEITKATFVSDIEVKVTGPDSSGHVIYNFSQAGFHPFLMENLANKGYTMPTDVQRHIIPIIAAGRDLMACAPTGSGKTIAFLLPILDRLMKDGTFNEFKTTSAEPQCLVLAPTMELAIQIKEEAIRLSHGSMNQTIVALDETFEFPDPRMDDGCNLLVATPGKFLEHLCEGTVSLDSLQFLVLVEAEHLLDLDFIDSFELCFNGTHQTLVFGSQMPDYIQFAAQMFLYNYLFLVDGLPVLNVIQEFHHVVRSEKWKKLQEILSNPGRNRAERTLIFVENKMKVFYTVPVLNIIGFPSVGIFGDSLLGDGQQALASFKDGSHPILVATDFAVCGLNIPSVEHVINYDMPETGPHELQPMLVYKERMGRASHVQKTGKATSFFDDEHDAHLAGPLVKILANECVDIPEWLAEADAGGSGGEGDSTDYEDGWD